MFPPGSVLPRSSSGRAPQIHQSRVDGEPGATEVKITWFRELNRYHWFVLSVASLGWMFDTMAQQLFNLARKPAVQDLMGNASDALVSEQAGYSTMIFMIGWAIGGIVFGIFGDRWGRVKTMSATILFYSGFTGLSFFATNLVQFN